MPADRIIDLRSDSFRYANAGHHPPYLVRNKQVLAVRQNDLLLRISPYRYTNYRLKLRQDDSLVFYSDGLTEARNKAGNGETYGTSRLETSLAAHNLSGMRAKRAVTAILKAVADEGFNIEDDITIQVYRHL